jgi:mannose/cellobiose epimerase-like protein (N-acyl-D-glucosamine 2-epimerase family)
MRLSRAGLRAHVTGELLPLWERHGIDRVHGGFWNRLAPDRTPVPDGYKRLLVQVRQIYAFARGCELGAGEAAREAAAQGFAFLASRFWDEKRGGWLHTTALDGGPLDRRRDLYGHAFAIFGLAEYHRVTGDGNALRLARETWALVQAHLRDAKHGGFFEAADGDWRPLDEPRRQNPHMHLFEALLALHRVAPGIDALAEAGALIALLETRFCDPRTGALGELFASDWASASGPSGAIVEPGHGFEWFSLLHQYAALGGDRGALALAEKLFAFAECHGLDRDGGVFDQVDRTGRPIEPTKRLWPQTERIRALALRGDVAALERALAHCGERYVEADGGWREHLARDGRPLTEARNATSVYHVVGALAEAAERSDGSG